MNANWHKTAKLLWIGLSFAIIIFALIYCDSKSQSLLKSECSLLISGVLALLNLPLGIVWFLLISTVGYLLDIAGFHISGSWLVVDAILWGSFLVIGYFQWFKGLPWIIRKWENWKKSK